MSSSDRMGADLSRQVEALAETLEKRLVADGMLDLPITSVQALMSALCKVYAASVENGEVEPPVAFRTGLGQTDAVVVCAGLLRATGMSAFELGFWQNATGR
jgi:hypothetical protein